MRSPFLCGTRSRLAAFGGEYHFLSKVYHPSVGFLAGWVSATVGFAAPVALAAMAFGKYLSGVIPGLPALGFGAAASLPPQTWLALLITGIVTLLLLHDVKMGSIFQDGATFLKIALIVVMIGAGALISKVQPVSFLPAAGDGKLITSGPFAVSLVYVMYAYSGWNASTYLAGELKNPSRTIPLSVGIGTGVVMLFYLLVNAVFLRSTPMGEMAGNVEVGLIAGDYLFGQAGGKVMAALICAGLVSSVSAMMWIGPRVTMAMGEDFPALQWLGRKTKTGIPAVATLTQCAIVMALLLTSSFEKVLTYVQFALQVCSFLTVLGVIVLRQTQPDLPRPYKAWGYPVTPIIFLSLSAWMLVHIWRSNPVESLLGLGTLGLGLLVYFLFPSRPQAGNAPHNSTRTS